MEIWETEISLYEISDPKFHLYRKGNFNTIHTNLEFRSENKQHFPLRGALEEENIEFWSVLG